MQVDFLGHAAFSIRNAQARLLLDPHRPGAVGGRFALPPIVGPFDAIAVSHSHEDHAGWTPALGTEVLYDTDVSFSGFSLQFRTVPHDDCGGTKMGFTRMIKVRSGGLVVVHCGDIGAFAAGDIAWLSGADLLLVPVGGTFTIDSAGAAALVQACAPKLVVPMHAADPRIDLPLAPIDDFLAACPRLVHRLPSVDLSAPPAAGSVVLLDSP